VIEEAGRRRTGAAAPTREEVREARMAAVRYARWSHRCGETRAEVARDLGVEERTLRYWQERWRRDRLHVKARGRRRVLLGRGQRREALDLLNGSEGRVGVLSLMAAVTPPAARSALSELKARWLYAAHRRGGKLCARLVWTRAGTVWALDWTDPEQALEGHFKKVLVVRDLYSGWNLLSLPCVRESGTTAARELAGLMARCGPPAAVKMDNGRSLAGSRSVRLELSLQGVLALVSPPATPGYNGACEAGIGALKAYAHHIASASGRGSCWSSDDVAAARRAVNTRIHEDGLSAEDRWATRRPLGTELRERLWRSYRAHLALEHKVRGFADAQPGPNEQASLDRTAISRALEEAGLLCFRRRWIRPPIRAKKLPRKW